MKEVTELVRDKLKVQLDNLCQVGAAAWAPLPGYRTSVGGARCAWAVGAGSRGSRPGATGRPPPGARASPEPRPCKPSRLSSRLPASQAGHHCPPQECWTGSLL